ncbi:MAG TPA: PIN domain-containing protein [Chloroflexota bacterium]|nr:PIN domain-containing protein [Chloroflexota bacterium]
MPVRYGVAESPLRIDANIILRFLTDAPRALADRAASLFKAVDAGKCDVILEDVVLAEVIWTLASYYGMAKKEIADALLKLLGSQGVTNQDKETLQLALVLFHEKNLNFADALLAARARQTGEGALYSFDKDFDRVPGLTRYMPGAPEAS